MEPVRIAGVGMHPFGHHRGKSLKDLVRVAFVRALRDAEVGLNELDVVYSANAMAGLLQGQEQIRGQTVLREVGVQGTPIVNVENACASGSTAFREAVIAVKSGVAKTALAIGFEKMLVDDRERTLSALQTAGDQEVIGGLGLQFTAVNAIKLRKRMDAGEMTLEDLAEAAVKSHANGALNPYAHHQRPVSSDEVLGSRRIAGPITLLMCSSFSDGAAAVVVQAAEIKPAQDRPAITVRASSARSGYSPSSKSRESTVWTCAQNAYEEAGVDPSDISVAEVHDALAPSELICYEELGFCGRAEAAKLLRGGSTSIHGEIAVNPSGGLSSRGHPVGATGLAQIAELVWQLRGEAGLRQVKNPRLGLAMNDGGWLEGEPASCNIHILERAIPWA